VLGHKGFWEPEAYTSLNNKNRQRKKNPMKPRLKKDGCPIFAKCTKLKLMVGTYICPINYDYEFDLLNLIV
jgi:hypothetical protein